jgi:HlyD family secretion protein
MVMTRSLVFIVLASIGIGLAVFVIASNAKEKPVPPVIFQPAHSPYVHFIAAQGAVEASSKNIAIGAAFNEIIAAIYVTPGQLVKAGDPLFSLQTRHLEAQLREVKHQWRYDQLDYQNKKATFTFYKKLFNKAATSKQAYSDARYAMLLAKARLKITSAAIQRIKIDINRSTTTAPSDGVVLQLNVNVGESATIQRMDTPMVLFGNVANYHVRIEVDEEDVWRIIDKASAVAFIRGNSAISFPLEFVYAEPFVVPKKSLFGSTFDRVDTRVKQLVYKCKRADLPVSPGQFLDVYLEAKPYQEKS